MGLETRKKMLALSLTVTVLAAAAGGAFVLRHGIHKNPQYCSSCHVMRKTVTGWSEGVHKDVQCLKCHESSLPLELAGVLRTATRQVTDVRPLKYDPDRCMACHPSNPRWKGIADDVDSQRTGDGMFEDLSVVAHSHLGRNDCGSCHAHTAHGSVELKAGEDFSAEPVVLDGRLNEAAWKSAEVLKVPIMGGNKIGRVVVELRAFRSGRDLLLAARWPDRRDDSEKAMWEMGTDGRWRTLGKTRAGEPGNEDRVMFLWNVNVHNMPKEGCLVTCHPGVSASKYLESPGVGDLWHWKAARSNPAGYCDDTYIDHMRTGDDGGRHGDSTDSKKGTIRNINKTGDGPGWIQKAEVKNDDPRFLFAKNAVPIPPDSAWTSGTRIPGYVIAHPDGSRGDLSAKGRWEAGFWTVEFRRKLVTGQPDDVNFTDLNRTYLFAVAVSDNASGAEHSFSGLLRLRFLK